MYRNRINSAKQNLLSPVEKHFRAQDHDFKRDARFIIIERIEHNNTDKIQMIIKKHENSWITRLKTLIPDGLIVKLNDPNYF